jgi:DNA modification methylase
MIPSRLAMALQDDGWVLRQEVIWDKGWCRPESVPDRVTRTHEMVYMFAKQRRYFYNPDPIRGSLPHTATNPMGRNSGSVWQIPPSQYRGQHDATFPEELVQRMLAVSCDELDSNVIVLDPFGGAGTTAKVALEAGYRAITIDNNAAATHAARERLARATAQLPASTRTKVAMIIPALAAE